MTTDHTARHLWGKIDTPIVAFTITPFDIARAVYQARKRTGIRWPFSNPTIPISSPRRYARSCRPISPSLSITADRIGPAKLRQAVQEGFRAVVGGATITALAHEVGVPCVTLLPSPEDILKTFQQAQQIASVRQIEQRQEMKFKYVVQYSFSGIIVTDEQNRIVVFNPAAEKIFEMLAERVIGQSLDEVIPQDQLPGIDDTEHPQLEELRKIQNRQLMVNRIPIAEEGRSSEPSSPSKR